MSTQSTFMDFCYKFADEAAAKAAFADYLTPDCNWITDTPQWSIVPLGTLTEPTGAIDDYGQPVMAAIEGWHLNFQVREGSGVEKPEAGYMDPQPKTPSHKFFHLTP